MARIHLSHLRTCYCPVSRAFYQELPSALDCYMTSFGAKRSRGETHLLRALSDSVCDSKRTSYERTRRVFVPGIAAILTVWLVQSALGLLPWTRTGASWIVRVHIPFTHLPLFMHWDLIVSFAVAGAISALYGAFVNSSPKQCYIAALFPVFFEILKWLWLLRFPIAPWIDPAHPPYRFTTLPVAASIGYWVIHIIIPAVALLGALSLFNRRFYARIAEEVKVTRTI